MKIKLDENIGRRGAELLRTAGHDVTTVRDQNLQGASDETLFKICAGEARVLITLDHDFGQVISAGTQRWAGRLGGRGAGDGAIAAEPSAGFF
jgi:predicted nuclease of predicted toxin-antitoxin system